MTSGAITARPAPPPASALTWLTTTDHKRIGIMYAVAAFGFFMVGGVLALLMRAELAQPGLQVMGVENYDQSFTMHGTIMMLLFGTPMVAAFATCPDGNEPKSEVTIMSSGRVRPNHSFSSCTTPALAADATMK